MAGSPSLPPPPDPRGLTAVIIDAPEAYRRPFLRSVLRSAPRGTEQPWGLFDGELALPLSSRTSSGRHRHPSAPPPQTGPRRGTGGCFVGPQQVPLLHSWHEGADPICGGLMSGPVIKPCCSELCHESGTGGLRKSTRCWVAASSAFGVLRCRFGTSCATSMRGISGQCLGRWLARPAGLRRLPNGQLAEVNAVVLGHGSFCHLRDTAVRSRCFFRRRPNRQRHSPGFLSGLRL